MTPLEQAIHVVGGVTALASAVGVGQSAVSNWQARTGAAPIEKCPAIEFATGAAVTCEQLRPDAAWVRVKDRSWPRRLGRPLLDLATAA